MVLSFLNIPELSCRRYIVRCLNSGSHSSHALLNLSINLISPFFTSSTICTSLTSSSLSHFIFSFMLISSLICGGFCRSLLPFLTFLNLLALFRRPFALLCVFSWNSLSHFFFQSFHESISFQCFFCVDFF